MNDYGSTDVFEEVEVRMPVLKPKQVLIKQMAVAIDPYDVKFRAGFMGRSLVPPIIDGSSVSGEVVAIGDEVTDFEVGQKVAASPHLHAYAQYVAVGQSQCAKIPTNVSFEQAAAAALGIQTAYQLVTDALYLDKNDSLLIHGIAGNVGLAVLQFARMAGVNKIYGTASERGIKYLAKFDSKVEVINYKKDDFTEKIPLVDKIVDLVGEETTTKSLKILKENGKLISTVNQISDDRVTMFFMKSNGQKLEVAMKEIARGNVHVEIAKIATFNVTNLRNFHDMKHVLGKLILRFS